MEEKIVITVDDCVVATTRPSCVACPIPVGAELSEGGRIWKMIVLAVTMALFAVAVVGMVVYCVFLPREVVADEQYDANPKALKWRVLGALGNDEQCNASPKPLE